MQLFVVVDGSGTPRLRGVPPDLSELGLPPPIANAIGGILNIDQPIPINAILGEVSPEFSVVLNAGLVLSGGDRVVLRFEFGPVMSTPPVTAQRHLEWRTFFAGQVPNRLGTHDWAIDLPAAPLVDLVAQQVNEQLKDEGSVVFHKNARGVWLAGLHPPGVQVSESGHVDNACAGNDVRFTLTVTARFTVPRPNVVRATVSLGFFKNDWDVAKCFGILLANPLFTTPLAFFITLFDHRGQAPFVMLLSLVPPQIWIELLLSTLIFGLDERILRAVIRKELAKRPTVISLPNDEYAIEREVDVGNPETRDWVVLSEIAGAEDRLLLRGELNVPAPILPRLTGRLGNLFSKWHRQNPCNLGSSFITTASMILGVAAANSPPGTRPNIGLKFARGRAFDIVDDALGVYEQVPAFSGSTRYTHIQYTVPGVFEVVVSNPVPAFLDSPYALRVRFFTSGGVRQYEIPAPPRFPQPQSLAEIRAQQREEQVWRINNCFIHSSLLMLLEALQVKWLPNPPPADVSIHQHWQVYIGGLAAGRQVIAWNQANGHRLAMMRANDVGTVELSLVIPKERPLDTVLLTLDDREFLTADEFRELMRSSPSVEEPDSAVVFVQQTLLYPFDEIVVGEPITGLELYALGENMYLHASVVAGEARTYRLGYPLTRGSAVLVPFPDGSMRVRNSLPRPRLKLRVLEAGGNRVVEVIDSTSFERTVAEFFERPWFDRGATLGPLFAQVTEDGHRVELFQRGVAEVVRPAGRDGQFVRPPEYGVTDDSGRAPSTYA